MTVADGRAERPLLEIAVQDAVGARIALDAGADRVELCQALGTGGLTPSLGTVDRVLEAVGDPARLAVLVRPRGGGFVYDREEIAVATGDILHLVSAGVTRLVVGALTAEGDVDADALHRWRAAAPDAHLVFHRAIDVAPDALDIAERLPALGVASVLTSGGAARSVDATDTLSKLVERMRGRLQIVAGGGIRVPDIPALVATGVAGIHLSARARALTGSAGPGGGEDGYDITDAPTVASAVHAVRTADARSSRPISN